MVMLAIIVVAWIGYLSMQLRPFNGSDIKIDVFKVDVREMPLCDAQHTTNCAVSKIDWNALRNTKFVH